jgi:DNA mismatch repair protein MutL
LEMRIEHWAVCGKTPICVVFPAYEEKDFFSKRLGCRMPGKIQVLPERIAQAIAAGEVVERPSSVVKELMENAIDAGSTEILVELRAGGLQLIRVADNGEGIEGEEVPVALQRYATSKIRKTEDLFSLQTLGFRGEALPSIASVSEVTLKTRVAHSLSGVKAVCEGGEIKSITEVGCPTGTEVDVKQLFYNVPVKRKFLKSIRSELNHVLNHFLKLGLAYPAISFKLIHDGRVLHDLVGTESHDVRIEAILGREVYAQLHPLAWKNGEIKVSGFASLPSLVKANAEGMYVFVNRRVIKDRIIHRAIVEAYRHVIPDGKFPVVILFITLPASAVDVNVHPTKAEVKFRDPDQVFQTVRSALRSLHDPAVSGGVRPSTPPSTVEDRELRQMEQTPFFPIPGSAVTFPSSGLGREGVTVPLVREFPQAEWKTDRPVPIRIVGEVQGTFLVCEGEQGLILIDQHAAHERILYEKFRKAYETRSLSVTQLLLPLLIEVTAEEAFTLSSSLEAFRSVGFEIDSMGEKTFAIRSIPTGIEAEEAPQMVREVLEEVALHPREGKATETIRTMLITLSCHRAIRGNSPLRKEEMEELVRNLIPFHSYTTCPHGRPIFFCLRWDELNKQFKRPHGGAPVERKGMSSGKLE